MKQLILITPDEEKANETDIINDLFGKGLQRLHLRKRSFTAAQYREYLSAISGRWHDRIVLTNCYELLAEFDVGGIHLNSFARNDSNTWRGVQDVSPAKISTSFHTWEEIEENSFPYGYAFISPVFDSISKSGYKAGIDLSRAEETKRKLAALNGHCPQIIGLGGVATEQIQILDNFGFDGAAMLGAIWQSTDPTEAFQEAMEVFRGLSGG